MDWNFHIELQHETPPWWCIPTGCCREHFQTGRGGVSPHATCCCRLPCHSSLASDVPPLRGGNRMVAFFATDLSPLRGDSLIHRMLQFPTWSVGVQFRCLKKISSAPARQNSGGGRDAGGPVCLRFTNPHPGSKTLVFALLFYQAKRTKCNGTATIDLTSNSATPSGFWVLEFVFL